MAPALAVDFDPTALAGDAVFRPSIVNTWASTLFDMSLEIDLTNAPGLAFVGSEPPIHNETRGVVRVDTSEPTFGIRAHSAQATIKVPSGAGALRIQVVPDDGTTLGPDLMVSVTDAVSTRPFITMDDGARGEPERVLLQDPGLIAAHGSGEWTVDVAIQPARADGRLDPHPEAAFTIILDAWFNTSLERSLVLDADGPLLPGNAQPFQAPLQAEGVTPGQSITITARTHMFYEHGDDTPDEALIAYAQTFVVEAGPEGEPLLGRQMAVASDPQEILGLDTVAEVIGYGAAFLLVASVLSGGILGKRSRRAFNRLFTTARRRVAFHNFLSYGILAAAIAHLVLFVVEINWHWAWGLLWGGLGILSLFALGFTGALQVPIIRKWGFSTWRWIHFGMALAAIGFTIIHILLDGSHFTVRDAIGWTDPLVPDSRQ